ncbi:MAG: cell division protein ZapC [Psychrobium sp.]|nr:cell division protein ZapC [Psychrobium sp.]
MLIKPNTDWQWKFCHQRNRLTLDMGSSMEFVTAFKRNELINDALLEQVFCIENSEDFYLYVEKLEAQLELPSDYLMQIALNALSAKVFYKPMMPKSWFFSTAQTVSSAQAGNVVKLQSNHEQRHYLVIESNTKASTLLLIERSHQLDNVKSLAQFGLIKVMNDRLIPVQICKTLKENAA